MARQLFGGDLAAYAVAAGAEQTVGVIVGQEAVLAPGITVTFWNLQMGGTQHVDLQNLSGLPIDHIVTSDGSDGLALGSFPQFWGPDDDSVWGMWASADGGPRQFVFSLDVAQRLAPLVAALQSQVTVHLAATNPHQTRLQQLNDVAAPAPANGQVLGYDLASGLWLPTDVEGITGVVTETGLHMISGVKTFTPPDTATTPVVLQALAGQVADLLAAYSGTGGLTFHLTANGELRVSSAAAGSVAAKFKGVAGQTANIIEITDAAGNPMAWADSTGRLRAPNLGYFFPYSVAGDLIAETGKFRIYNDTGVPLIIRSVRATVNTPPAGSGIVVDVNLNGVSIYAAPADQPTIAAGATTSGKNTAMSVTPLLDGDYLTVDVDAVGSTAPGKDLTVQVLAY